MGDGDDRPSERIREEVAPQSDDPLVDEVDEEAREGSLTGKVDHIAQRLAGALTADSRPHRHEGLDIAPPPPHPTHETGTGSTVDLAADAERRLRPGEELVARLPDTAPTGWTYSVDGDERALDISERAELVAHSGEHRHTPAVGASWQFVVHALRRGRATVRFEPLDARGDGGGGPIRLRIEVR